MGGRGAGHCQVLDRHGRTPRVAWPHRALRPDAPPCPLRRDGSGDHRDRVRRETSMKRLTAAILALGLLAMTGDRALAQGPVSTEKVKIVVGYQPLTPTWGVTILTGAQLWKPYLPNVEVERFNSMSGMPLVNNILAGKVDLAYMGDMPAIVLGSKRSMAETKFLAVTDADEGGASVIYVKNGSPIKS